MASAALVQCTFYGNAAPQGGNISGDCSGDIQIVNCIVAASTQGEGVFQDSGSLVEISCTDIHGNAEGDWVGNIADQEGLNGNICLDPLFCSADSGDFSLAAESPCLPDFNPDCGMIGAHPQGCGTPAGLAEASALIPECRLLGAAPNPFNPRTSIFFTIDRRQQIRLAVFDLKGGCVAVLADGSFDPGLHEVTWQGRDSGGRELPSGTYLLRLLTGDRRQVPGRKITLLR